MRRGGSRYVREDATSSVQLAGVMLGAGRRHRRRRGKCIESTPQPRDNLPSRK
ncbi:hypothetical protein WH47_07362 [Habropoda laboriosa]|uniref:Uncharacterized protein n=1 Tax=Habropoda laboriosa TaxID=597456 RepID=A0A0L7R619_9HYME|nr:hypothetical protein WH47_07362 [Habropoda laboriosa]